jgi:hypothetical protein
MSESQEHAAGDLPLLTMTRVAERRNREAAGQIKKEPDLRGRAGTRRLAVGLTKNSGGEIEESLSLSAQQGPESRAKDVLLLDSGVAYYWSRLSPTE